MAFQPVNFLGTQLLRDTRGEGLMESLMQGMQARNLPQRLQGENEKTRLANALTQQYGGQEKEAEIGYKQAQAEEARARAEFGGTGQGPVQNWRTLQAYLAKVGNGDPSAGALTPEGKGALRIYNAHQNAIEGQNLWREKSHATQTGKSLMELGGSAGVQSPFGQNTGNQDVGISGNPLPGSPGAQLGKNKPMVNKLAYEAMKLDLIAKAPEYVQKKVDASKNVHISLSEAPAEAFMPYVGPAGFKKLIDDNKRNAAGNPTPEYLRYLSAKKALEMGTKQSAPFYDTPADKQAQERLYKLMNPLFNMSSGVLMSPASFKVEYNTPRNLLIKESKTYYDRTLNKAFDDYEKQYGISSNAGQGAHNEQNSPNNPINQPPRKPLIKAPINHNPEAQESQNERKPPHWNKNTRRWE